MHEFVTVSASSYDPAALAAKLTEKSSEGWEIVAIVPTGGDVTAFCRRATGATAAVPEAEAIPVAVPAATPYEPSSSIEELAAATAAAETPEPVAEVTPELAPEEPVAASPWAAETSTAAPAAEPTPTTEPAPVEPAPAEPAAYAPVSAPTQPAQPAQPQVPAGWYADPSGRFELRYWDGNGWTEHVARGGQQSTDPPVA